MDGSDSTSGSCANGKETSIGVFNASFLFHGTGGNREQERVQIISF